MKNQGRPSRAEIKRRIAAATAPEQPAPPLPPDIAEYVATYVPRDTSSAVWAVIKAVVLDILARYEPKAGALESAKQRLVALTAYVAWAHGLGYDLDRETLLDNERVEAFANSADGVSKTTAANYRSRLRGIVKKVNPSGTGSTATVQVAHRKMKPPYDPRQKATIVRIARTQPNETTGRQLRACVGLGLGAGLDSSDIKPLLVDHVIDLGQDGIRVEVPGDRARTVWVRREHEALVRSSILGLRPGQPVVGVSTGRKNVAAKIFEQAVIVGDAPHFEQSRMRTTWLAELLMSNVPLPVIMKAAGLTSARSLTEIVQFLDVDLAATDRQLRGDA